MMRRDLLGSPAAAGSGARDIVIGADTRSVHVTGGEVINFVVGATVFSWNFDVGTNVYSFPLNTVAPDALLAQTVTAYVATDPRYLPAP